MQFTHQGSNDEAAAGLCVNTRLYDVNGSVVYSGERFASTDANGG